MSQLIIGLTGGIASGKTTVADMFATLGVDLVDADIVAREVVAVGTPALIDIEQHFGAGVIQENGELDRSALRNIIFNDENEKQWLNNLLHPLIRQTIVSQLNDCRSPYCILVAPLLLENNMQGMVNSVLVVDVDVATQISRTMARDGSSLEQARAIIASQIDREQRLKSADYVIKNTGMINKLTNDVKKLHHEYSKIAQEGS
ncbi:dephospho-CoA kinase [Psychrobium sp. MM17-31]|uniref:dephospho-CoA kinase n=1 Tax=Psychrobium sp. MM17-31 TaxID=2917758 RepID=UPI001EF44EA2|nr:dephospho-CoA kinase [Psychrobium sp. MM17-31]MCG7533246.1 dephospho-CoA kinase [Psychrobium sp. MM17-31]